MAIPTDISGLVLWYDPSSAGTVTMSGANVTAITGRSGYGPSLSPATGGVTKGTQLSRDTLLFGSGTSGLTGTLAAPWTAHAYSVFAAFKHNNLQEFTRGISLQSSDSGNDYGNAASSIPFLATSGVPGFHRNGGAVNAPAAYTGAWHVVSVVTTATGVTFGIDGTTVATGSQANTALSAEWFGIGGQAMGSQTGDGWRGEFGEVIAFNRTLNSTEQTQMVDYLLPTWVTGTAPGTWTGSPGSATVTGTPGLWSMPGMYRTWSDTTFTNINSGGDYNTFLGNPGFPWQTGTAGQVTGPAANQQASSRRLDACVGEDQYVKVSVNNLAGTVHLCTHAPTPMTEFGGYFARWLGAEIYWYKDGAYQGSQSYTPPSGAGTLELRVIAGVATLYFNGTAGPTKTYAAPVITGRPYQGFGVNSDATIFYDAEGGDYTTGLTWTRSTATLTVTGESGAWAILGGPQTWTASAGTVTVSAPASTWSTPLPPSSGWTDTDFVSINSGGNYDTFLANPGFPWRVGTGEVQGPASNQYAGSRRLDACVGESQYVKITVNSLGTHAQVFTHAPTPMIEYGGYYARWLGDQVYWYQDGAFSGNNSYTPPAGGGTIELRTVAGVSSLYLNGTLAASKTWGTLITGRPYQGFAANADNVVITDAEGGALAGPLTWTRSLGTALVTGNTATWSQSGAQAWTGSVAAATVAAVSDLWAYVNPGGFRLGAATVRALKMGTVAVTKGYMGVRQVWPPVPQNWTSSPTTARVTGTSGNWYLPGMWVFADSFSAGMTHWSPSRWNAMNWTQDPGHVHNSDNVAGSNGVLPPNDVAIYGNRLWVCAGSQNYGDAIARCDQPFEFAGGGIIEVDLIIWAQDTLLGWPQLLVSDVPMSNPMSQDDNASGPPTKYGFTVRFNAHTLGGQPAPIFMVWNNYAETKIGATGPGAVTSRTEPTTVRIEFTHSHVDTYANGVLWSSTNWTLPPSLTEGFVYLGSHNHAAIKYRLVPSVNTVFAGVRFDGIPRTPTKVSRVPDRTVRHDGMWDGLATTGVDIAYTLPTAALTLPAVAAGVTSARLVLSTWVDNNLPDVLTRLNYQLNGGAVHPVAFDPPVGAIGSGARNFSVPINPAELVTGDNTVVFSGTGMTTGYFPFIGNIQLVYTT